MLNQLRERSHRKAETLLTSDIGFAAKILLFGTPAKYLV
jgi:hypothetical protein